MLVVVFVCFGGAVAALLAMGFLAGGAEATPICNLYWTGAVSSSWGGVGNWSTTDGGVSAGRIPIPTDYVCMSTEPVRADITNSDDRTIDGINFAATATVSPSLKLRAGTFTVNGGDSTLNNVTMNGTVLTGSAALTLTGANTIRATDGFTIAGTGQKTIAAGATVDQGGVLRIGDAGPGGATRVVNNGSWNTGLVYLATQDDGQASGLTNAGNLVLGTDERDPSVGYFGGGAQLPYFINTGTLSNALGWEVLTLDIPFTNMGTYNTTDPQTYILQGNVPGTTDTGMYVVPYSYLWFEGGQRTVSGAVTGDGYVDVTGGTTTLDDASIARLSLDGGTVRGTGSVGDLFASRGKLIGRGKLTATGNSYINGVTIRSGFHLRNEGTMAYTQEYGNLVLTKGGRIDNAATFAIAPWTNPANGIIDVAGAGGGFVNLKGATLAVGPAAAGQLVRVGSFLTNHGSVMVSGATTLELDRGDVAGASTDDGTFSVAPSSELVLAGGVRSISGAVSGDGAVTIMGGDVTFAHTASVSNLSVTGGTVHGSPMIGTFSLGAAATLGVRSTTAQITVTGSARVSGALAITTAAHPPALGTSRTLIRAGSVTGTFSSVTGQDVPSVHAYWKIDYSATRVWMTLTAQPG